MMLALSLNSNLLTLLISNWKQAQESQIVRAERQSFLPLARADATRQSAGPAAAV